MQWNDEIKQNSEQSSPDSRVAPKTRFGSSSRK